MTVPAELKYTSEHEWIRIDGNIATIGITNYAQEELGDIVFVELPNVGEEFNKADTFGTIEAVKAVSDLYSPLTGKITEINAELDDSPMIINNDPFGEGWMVKIELKNVDEIEQLLSETSYKALIEE